MDLDLDPEYSFQPYDRPPTTSDGRISDVDLKKTHKCGHLYRNLGQLIDIKYCHDIDQFGENACNGEHWQEDADTVDAADNIVESVEQDTFGARLERLDSEQERVIRAQGFNATPRSPTPLSDRMPAPETVARSPPSRPSEHESVTGAAAAAANELSAGTRSTAEGASRQPGTAPSPTRMHSGQLSEHGNGLGAAAADELPAGIRSVTGGAGPQFSPTWYPTRTHSRQPIEHSSGLGAIAAAHGHSERAWSASGGTSPQVKSS
ncbi:hypothetical protein HDK64DRAFT_66405 [Phyllosticta capitalensis]